MAAGVDSLIKFGERTSVGGHGELNARASNDDDLLRQIRGSEDAAVYRGSCMLRMLCRALAMIIDRSETTGQVRGQRLTVDLSPSVLAACGSSTLKSRS